MSKKRKLMDKTVQSRLGVMDHVNMHRGKLTITLMSDLCTGSGMAYAGIIDSDIFYDKYGIPEIQGRRLKGCMREAAGIIGITDSNQLVSLFGKKGHDHTCGVYIDNAVPLGSWELKKFMELLEYCNESELQQIPEAQVLTQSNILDLYTSIRAQTKIEDKTGVADDTTLRFTRVINQYDFVSGENVVFEANVVFKGTGENWELLKKIAKATRNIGQNRNRGMGSVRMELIDSCSSGSENLKRRNYRKEDDWEINCRKKSYKGETDSAWKQIFYQIHNVQPLMLSGNKDSSSQNIINGSSVLGALAAEYLKKGSADDPAFQELFLGGAAMFSDLMIAKPDFDHFSGLIKWIRYTPAPYYLRRLKKTKKLVSLAAEKQCGKECGLDEAYDSNQGNLPKKLNNNFVAWDNERGYSITEVKRTLIYHNSIHGETKDGEKGLLYSAEAIEEGQYFTGDILVRTEYEGIICSLLHNVDFRFGKSKTAQYGKCELIAAPVVKPASCYVKADGLTSGKEIMVTFLSNAQFVTDNGTYTVNEKDIRQILEKELAHGKEGVQLKTDKNKSQSWLQSCEITGYNTKWNLKKQAVPAISMGSALSFTLEGNLDQYPLYVGERNLEGFGRIRINLLDQESYAVSEWKPSINVIEAYEEAKKTNIVRVAYCNILTDQLGKELRAKAFQQENLDITATALGRLTLMLTEAKNDFPDNSWEQYISLRTRIASITSDAVQSKILTFMENELGKDFLGTVQKKKNGEKEENLTAYMKRAGDMKKQQQIEAICNKMSATKSGKQLKEVFPEKSEELLLKSAMAYLMDILVYQRYCKKMQNTKEAD